MATSVSNISVSFRLFKESEVRSISVVDIQNASTFDHGVPKPHGLQDAHMGTTDRSIMCQTCHLAHCAGHFGMIELPKRVYYAGHVKRIMLLLRTMCTICIRPLLGEEIARKISASAKGFDKLKIVSDTSRKLSVCPHCKFALPSITDTNKLFIQRQWSDTDYEKMPAEAQTFLTTRFSADDAYTIIDAMPDSWLGILGFTISSSHPRDAIPRCILVLPPAQRPTLRIADGGKGRGEDDMTMLYQEVVRAKLDLETKLDYLKLQQIIDKFNSFAKMQLCVACLIKSSYKKSCRN
jgi:DNA-directed RNA polymerase beta' subunit